VLCWFLLFICAHVTMVFLTDARVNLNHMFYGVNSNGAEGSWIAAVALTLASIAWIWASPFTLKNARLVQRVGKKLVGHGWAEAWDVSCQYTEADISPRLWTNGALPVSEEFNSLLKHGFSEYKLRVDGLVEEPTEFSYAQIKAMPKQEQITSHFCVQGWSGVAKWAGVPMRHVLDLVKPKAKYVVFYSFAEGGEGGRYYDVHRIHNMRHELSLLAYEMNGQPLTVLYGPHCGCGARTSWDPRWSSGSKPSNSWRASITWAQDRVATTKTTNFSATACPSERHLRDQDLYNDLIVTSPISPRSNKKTGLNLRTFSHHDLSKPTIGPFWVSFMPIRFLSSLIFSRVPIW
jgi:hypothetical protein